MNLLVRPWLICSLGLMFSYLPPANAGMTPAEVKRFEESMAKANKGEATAQTGVAICYSIGMGVDKDDELAVFWWRKAAEQGEATAQSLLGLKYQEGRGVARDYEKAVFWWRKAAEQGMPQAQRSLADSYMEGLGVEKDMTQATFWWLKAALQGHVMAQFNLGLSYATGRGVAKDEIEAYAYWNLAGITNEDARHNLSILEKEMTPESRIQGQRRTKELQKEIEEKKAEK
jgi:TPR repeat protein